MITTDNHKKFQTLEKRTEDVVTTTASPTLDMNVLLSAIDNMASVEAGEKDNMEEAEDAGSDKDIKMSKAIPGGSKAVARWDEVGHLLEEEKIFRINTNSEAIERYFCEDGGLLARNFEVANKGLMSWKNRDTAAERLGIGSMGNVEERIWREWDLLKKIEVEDEKFTAMKRLENLLTNIGSEIDGKSKSRLFHLLSVVGLAPHVFYKKNLMPEGQNEFGVVVFVPGIISEVRMNGKLIKVVAEAKSKFSMDLAETFKLNKESFIDLLRKMVSEIAEWGSLDNNEKVVWSAVFPSNISSVNDWIVYKPDLCPKKTEKKLQRDSIRWKEKMERNEINQWLAGCRLSDIGSELWTISESVWPELEKIVTARWIEVLQELPILGVDFEGGGCVGQFALASYSGISTFVFIGGFFPTTLTRLISDVSPMIIGGRYELSRYLGGSRGLSSLDPFVVMRDVPGMESSYGIADLAKVCLGLDLHRLKKIGAMCIKRQFSDLSLKELQYGFVRLSDWYQREQLTIEQSFYAALDAEVLVRAIIMAMWLETALRQFSYTEEVITLSSVLDWWSWAINVSCNTSQLQRVSSTISGTTINERRLAFFGKAHFFSHSRGKEYSVKEEDAISGPIDEKLGQSNRTRALIDDYGRSRSIKWKKRDGQRINEVKRRIDNK